MTTGKILGIAYNVIPVTNVEQSAAWFVNHFGFNIRQPREGYISLFRDNRPILDLIESDHDSRAVFQVKQKKRWVITFLRTISLNSIQILMLLMSVLAKSVMRAYTESFLHLRIWTVICSTSGSIMTVN